MADERENPEEQRRTFNMWTKPASGESPSLEALEEIQGDEEVSLTPEDLEDIDRGCEIFEERSSVAPNGETFYP